MPGTRLLRVVVVQNTNTAAMRVTVGRDVSPAGATRPRPIPRALNTSRVRISRSVIETGNVLGHVLGSDNSMGYILLVPTDLFCNIHSKIKRYTYFYLYRYSNFETKPLV